MEQKKISWENIDKLEDHFITYLLYKEGKSPKTIAKIRRMNKKEVEQHIIRSKIEINKKREQKEDLLIKIISMDKESRLEYLNKLNKEEREKISQDIYKRYIKFKNPDDRMILIWLIGELKNKRLLPFLRMELKSKNVNYRRLACSALGKIKDKDTKKWLERVLTDENPQVRQYAAKALSHIGDLETVNKLKKLTINPKEKEYVKRAAMIAITEILS
ncbi:HEAT repeat domain-containing protein [Thermohalobacter berrensis]|uniref:PBS lyase n=1 Tax=Thermohalobacter berrensis TaxID=99594 RepID=A0A419TB44_9FIRM|nr:HEAT repeat domain-containing protein [Thermohalobacter berrensis]RKD34683.1 hypothetical protein BET03_02325 [Thermohalobacter berrensis]